VAFYLKIYEEECIVGKREGTNKNENNYCYELIVRG
jgi:hypothetical protein